MMKRFLLLLPFIAVGLLACGSAESHDPKSNEEAVQSPVAQIHYDLGDGTAATANTLPDREDFRPLGMVDVSALSTPENAPDDWRKVAAEQLIVLKTAHGSVVIEMTPQFAPGHTQRFSQLAKENYYVGLPFHRVISGFMAQAGNTALVSRPRPTTEMLNAEFHFRRAPTTKMTVTGERRSADAGFIDGFKIASQPQSLAMMTADGKVQAWQLHCPGAVAAARLGTDINSANAEFYITMSYPENLDKNYTVWGRVRAGFKSVFKIKRGEPPMPPDMIEMFALVSEIDAAIAPSVWVMNTESPAFVAYLEGLRNEVGTMPDICDIDVPVIVRWP
ncbi:MAG: peptidylprolyl isomerase [Robiginitomaculum sp.]|nr:peptidylprolyl isomerase [Robiginitomaculum sp.]